jgi:hypothetical protein
MENDLNAIKQRQSKIDCYWLSSGKILVPKVNGKMLGYKEARINIQNDADFYIQGVTGSYGYLHESEGKKVLKPLPANLREDVAFRIEDGSSGQLSNDYVAVETFFSGGGVGKPLQMVLPFRHIVQRGSYIVFKFQNASEHDFEINFTLHGLKYI